MAIKSVAHLIDELGTRLQALSSGVQGPADTQYGWGWQPTSTFWVRTRRVHFYEGLRGPRGSCNVEVVDRSSTSRALLRVVHSADEAWDVLRSFLVEGKNVAGGANSGWTIPKVNQDDLIPQPPDKPNPANIASFCPPSPLRSDEPTWIDRPPDLAKASAVIALLRISQVRARDRRATATVIECMKGPLGRECKISAPSSMWWLGLKADAFFEKGEEALVFAALVDGELMPFSIFGRMPLSHRGSRTVAESFCRDLQFFEGLERVIEGSRWFVDYARFRELISSPSGPARGG